MPLPVRSVLVHAQSGTELSRLQTEFRLRLSEPSDKSPLESRGADTVMQSCAVYLLLQNSISRKRRGKMGGVTMQWGYTLRHGDSPLTPSDVMSSLQLPCAEAPLH